MRNRILTILIALDIRVTSFLNGKLNLAEWVKSAFCGYVGILCSFCSHKRADVVRYLANNNSSLPSTIAALGNTKIPVRVFRVRLANILSIFASSSFTKIVDCVVARIVVNVVNVVFGPIPVNIKPRKPMSFVDFPIRQPDPHISLCVSVASRFTGPSSFLPTFQPDEKSSQRIVREVFFKVRLGQCRIFRSHAVVPSKQWFGQKPRCASNTSGLRHFNSVLIGCPV